MSRAGTMPNLVNGAGHHKETFLDLWCALMHDEVSWPIRGRYHCKTCNRTYRVPWDEPVVLRLEAPGLTKRSGAIRPETLAA